MSKLCKIPKNKIIAKVVMKDLIELIPDSGYTDAQIEENLEKICEQIRLELDPVHVIKCALIHSLGSPDRTRESNVGVEKPEWESR